MIISILFIISFNYLTLLFTLNDFEFLVFAKIKFRVFNCKIIAYFIIAILCFIVKTCFINKIFIILNFFN